MGPRATSKKDGWSGMDLMDTIAKSKSGGRRNQCRREGLPPMELEVQDALRSCLRANFAW